MTPKRVARFIVAALSATALADPARVVVTAGIVWKGGYRDPARVAADVASINAAIDSDPMEAAPSR